MLDILNDLSKKPTTELALQIMELSSENLILEQQCKKQKEMIDRIKNVQIEMPKSNYSYDYMIYRSKIDEILKEVSE